MIDDDRVFKALADRTRRLLLDRLFERDGATLSQLEAAVGADMTRFGVMKHLRVLEEAQLVVTRKVGREKQHFLNVVPIRLIHDRWIDKYTEHHVSALVDLKNHLEGEKPMTSQDTGTTATTARAATTQVYRVYIKATPQKVWDALVQPEWTQRYGYGGIADYELKPGGRAVQTAGPGMQAVGFTGPVVDGEIIEADPPNKLVLTFRMLMDPGIQAEGFTRVTHVLAPVGTGTRLTLTHELEGAPGLAAMVGGDFEDSSDGGGGGWAWVLSDLKSLLETGEPLAGNPLTTS